MFYYPFNVYIVRLNEPKDLILHSLVHRLHFVAFCLIIPLTEECHPSLVSAVHTPYTAARPLWPPWCSVWGTVHTACWKYMVLTCQGEGWKSFATGNVPSQPNAPVGVCQHLERPALPSCSFTL